MPETCPVCEEPVEHARYEGSAASRGAASFDVDDLCAVSEGTRWDRICTRAVPGDQGPEPVLEVYYHFFGDGD
jgi:hypothetical protein